MPKPTVRFRIDFSRDEAVGPGKISLLEQIAATGSLSQAARNLKMSYRRAWLLLEDLNVAFADRVAVMNTGGRGGGGATVTAFGRTLIETYRAFEKDIQQRAERHFQTVAQLARLGSIPRAKPSRRISLSNRAR